MLKQHINSSLLRLKSSNSKFIMGTCMLELSPGMQGFIGGADAVGVLFYLI